MCEIATSINNFHSPSWWDFSPEQNSVNSVNSAKNMTKSTIVTRDIAYLETYL